MLESSWSPVQRPETPVATLLNPQTALWMQYVFVRAVRVTIGSMADEMGIAPMRSGIVFHEFILISSCGSAGKFA